MSHLSCRKTRIFLLPNLRYNMTVCNFIILQAAHPGIVNSYIESFAGATRRRIQSLQQYTKELTDLLRTSSRMVCLGGYRGGAGPDADEGLGVLV